MTLILVCQCQSEFAEKSLITSLSAVATVLPGCITSNSRGSGEACGQSCEALQTAEGWSLSLSATEGGKLVARLGMRSRCRGRSSGQGLGIGLGWRVRQS